MYGFAEGVSLLELMQTALLMELFWFVSNIFFLNRILQDPGFLRSRLGKFLCVTWVQSDANGVALADDSTTTNTARPEEERHKAQANEVLAKWCQGRVLPSLNHEEKELQWFPFQVKPFQKQVGSCSETREPRGK